MKLVQTFGWDILCVEFQKYLKHISWVIIGTSSSKLSCNPRHPSRNIRCTIWCNHRDNEYFLHRKNRKPRSTAISTVITRLLPLTDYMSGTENETRWALFGHTNGNIEMRSPSAAAMMTMIVWFPQGTDARDTLALTYQMGVWKVLAPCYCHSHFSKWHQTLKINSGLPFV